MPEPPRSRRACAEPSPPRRISSGNIPSRFPGGHEAVPPQRDCGARAKELPGIPRSSRPRTRKSPRPSSRPAATSTDTQLPRARERETQRLHIATARAAADRPGGRTRDRPGRGNTTLLETRRVLFFVSFSTGIRMVPADLALAFRGLCVCPPYVPRMLTAVTLVHVTARVLYVGIGSDRQTAV